MQAPHRIHFREVLKSEFPNLLLRPLSVRIICNSPPYLGPVKCEVYCVAGVPKALRDNNPMNTLRSRVRGIIFSIPILAMCKGGTEAPISAFPSLVQTTNVPVSATAKFAPVMPAPAFKNLGRELLRMASFNE